MINYIIILLFAVLALGGCQATKTIVLESEFLRELNRTGEAVQTIKSVDLSTTELVKLTHITNKFANFADKWDDPTDALKYGGDELKSDYLGVKAAYIDLHGLVMANHGQYSVENWRKLEGWHEHAMNLDKAALSFADHEKYVDMAGEVLELVRTGVLVLRGAVMAN